MNNIHFSSKSDLWATPQAFYSTLHAEFGFTLDPCSTHENAKCEKHYTAEDDGLSKDWSGERVFMNPPYGREIGNWIAKACEGGQRLQSCFCQLAQILDGSMNIFMTNVKSDF